MTSLLPAVVYWSRTGDESGPAGGHQLTIIVSAAVPGRLQRRHRRGGGGGSRWDRSSQALLPVPHVPRYSGPPRTAGRGWRRSAVATRQSPEANNPAIVFRAFPVHRFPFLLSSRDRKLAPSFPAGNVVTQFTMF